MRVTHEEDHITSTIIGGGQAIEFGVSSSAEFFNILSSTLYKDQMRAVIREVMCNAWDAHIDAGITDKPIQIELTAKHLSIKDFGKGIHQDDIGPIYCVYGNSTKKDDQNSTGGFGLGCKAPYAYTDSFEVISCHEGTKTLWAMSKASHKAMGKPTATPIFSMPTDESGITVKIPIEAVEDQWKFRNLITEIAKYGEILTNLNGEILDMVPISKAPYDFMVMRETPNTASRQTVYVRYGNVVYPIETTQEIEDRLDKVKNILRSIDHSYQIVFMAPPDSLVVTPSRESLSMQPHTISTLNKLMSDFVELHKLESPSASMRVISENIDEAIKLKKRHLLFGTSAVKTLTKNITYATTVFECTALAYNRVYPSARFLDDINYRLDEMYSHKMIDTSDHHELKKILNSCEDAYGVRYCDYWLGKTVIKKMMTFLYNDPELDHRNLFLKTPAHLGNSHGTHSNSFTVPAQNFSCIGFNDQFAFYRRILVLTTSRSDLDYRIGAKIGIGTEPFNYECLFVYRTSHKKTEREYAKKAFEARGFQVIDLTTDREKAAKKPKATTTTRAKGIIRLSDSLFNHYEYYVSGKNTDRLENPKYFIKITKTFGLMSPMSPTLQGQIIRDYEKETVVVTSDAQVERCIKKGYLPLKEAVFADYYALLKDSPETQNYYERREVCKHLYAELILDDPILLDHFDIKIGKISDETKLRWEILTVLATKFSRSNDDQLASQAKEILAHINRLKSDKSSNFQQLMEKRCDHLGCLDYSRISHYLESPDPKMKALARKFLITALEG